MTRHRLFVELVDTGYLRVDRDGSVWRLQLKTNTGIKTVSPIRADYLENTGYRRVKYGRPAASIGAHILVWLVLEGPIPRGQEVNHKNGNKADNRIDNLELLTHSGNIQHAYRELKAQSQVGASNANSKLTESQVIEIRNRAANGEPRATLALQFGITRQMVGRIVRGVAWRHQEFPA